jgi:hypothetical protein
MNQKDVLRELIAAAQRFVNKAPRYRRIEADRRALLDALTRAELLLSLREPSKASPGARPGQGRQKNVRALEQGIKEAKTGRLYSLKKAFGEEQ